MNILVCAKQVPDDEAKVYLSEGIPDTAKISKIVNAFDGYATEMALRHCEKDGGEVTVITLGDETEVKASMVQLLAVGGKHAYIGSAVEGDEATAASALAELIKKAGDDGNEYGLILCGKESTDEISSQVGAILAEKLGLPLVTSVVEFEQIEGGLKVKKETDEGYEFYQVALPAVFTVAKPDYELRYPSIRSKMAARKANIPVVSEIMADVASVICKGYEEPKKREAGIKIQEEEDTDAVAKAMNILLSDKVL